MANIRASAAVTTLLVATASAVSIGVSAAGGVTATAQPTPVIRVSAFAVPISVLENQTVLMSDFRAFDIGQVTIDVATVTDDVAISFNTSFSDTAAASDAITSFNTAKDIADSATIADALAKELTRPDVSDPVSTADTINTFAVDKPLTDTATMADTVAKTPGKVTTDSVAAADTSMCSPGLGKTDSVTGSDAINVDTIRTESYSYMLAGYTLNGNQLN